MKWLITGGCGFIGTNLSNHLLARGDDLTILDNLSRVGSNQNLAWLRQQHGSDWRFIEEDVRHPQSLDRVISHTRPDAIAHLAGQVAMTTSIADPRLDFEINALGTFNLMEAVRRHSAESIVLFSSTNKVYGPLDTLRYQERETRYIAVDYPQGLAETLPLDGHSPYGCSKLAAEQYVHDYHRIYNIPTVVFRHSSMYGARQFATYDQGWIGWFCQKAVEMSNPNAAPFTISGDGKQVRDLLHADDLIRVYLDAASQITKTAGQVYNIGGGMENSLSLLELFRELEERTGAPMRFHTLLWRAGDQKVFVADNGKALADIGWQPEVRMQEGLDRMLDWTRSL